MCVESIIFNYFFPLIFEQNRAGIVNALGFTTSLENGPATVYLSNPLEVQKIEENGVCQDYR